MIAVVTTVFGFAADVGEIDEDGLLVMLELGGLQGPQLSSMLMDLLPEVSDIALSSKLAPKFTRKI